MLDRILIGSSAEPSDPNFKNVTLLLHGDGSNGAQNNTFIDSSTNNFTITRNGNTTQGSFSPYGSNWSNYFDASGDYLTLPYSTALQFPGDFTIECWVYLNSKATSFPCIVSNYSSYTTNGGFALFAGHNFRATKYTVSFNGSYPVLTSTSDIVYGSWTHIAIVRSGSTLTLYINGVSESTGSSSATVTGTADNWWIGSSGDSTTSSYIDGYISNLRAVKGTAVYTANFTPPATPLTAITNTSLLTCQSNRFRDASTNNFTITRNGDVKVTNFAPFAPSSAYSTSTNGGSAYFDGSGDYLSTPSNTAFAFGTGDFAIECWVYRGDSNGTGLFESRGGSAGFLWYIDGSNQYARFYDQNTAAHFTSTITVPVGAWTHLAVTRSSGTLYFWMNGQAAGSNAYTVNVGSSATLRFYASNDAAAYLGYGSNMRAVKGSAVYTAAFTPPTSPVTAISGTSVLLNATNAAIFDNSMKNDLETVGNAQISTSVKKFGTGSMAFDGTGDWLTLTATPALNQVGNFTQECWIYLTAYPSSAATSVYGFETGNFLKMGISTTGQLLCDKSGVGIQITGSTLALNTWYHIALVRNGSASNNVTLYLNGTSAGQATGTDTVIVSGTGYVARRTDSSNVPITGYIDDLRITSGIARYTANFTPPTAAFPNK